MGQFPEPARIQQENFIKAHNLQTEFEEENFIAEYHATTSKIHKTTENYSADCHYNTRGPRSSKSLYIYIYKNHLGLILLYFISCVLREK